MGGRLTLIKSVLDAIPIYWMSIFRLSGNIRKRIEQVCKIFFLFGGTQLEKKLTALWHGDQYAQVMIKED
jgi:hypothetical protein